jgi:HK97 family phage major capsid protein
VRFGSSGRGRELAADVRDRIVRSLSVGYSVDQHEWDADGNTLTVNRWTPHEVSAVAVPADTSAGFYRNGRISMSDSDRGAPDGGSRSQRRAERAAESAERAAEGLERERSAQIAALAQRHGVTDRVAGWLAAGTPLQRVHEEILEARASRGFSLPSAEQLDERMRRPERGRSAHSDDPIPLEELRNYSLLRAIRSQVMGGEDRRAVRDAGFELECSRVLSDRSDRAPKGLLVPEEVIFGVRDRRGLSSRTMTVGSLSGGGELVATNLLAGEFIETLNNQPQVIALGARRLQGLVGNAAIPRMTAGSGVQWISEGADYGDTAPTFDQPQLTPHDLSARVDISRRLMIQSTPAADEIVRSDLALRIGIGMDQAAILGSGTSNQPVGILNTIGIGSVALGVNGAAPSWDAVTEVIETIAAANGLRGFPGFLVNGATMGTLMRTPMVDGFPRFIWEAGAAGARPDEGTIGGYRALVSNNVPSNLTKGTGVNLSALIFGNWRDLIVGEWRGIDILVDPYSQSSTGTLRITAIQTCDILVRHAASFCAILDAVTT